MKTELSEIKSIKDELNKYVRELEQQNDDLERAKRSTLASLEDFESKMNTMIERNAFLESELDEKESLRAAVQRLKDETRDLRSELRVVSVPDHQSAKRSASIDSSGVSGAVEAVTSVPTPDNDKSFKRFSRKKSEKNNNLDSNRQTASSGHLTPSTRLSALNIVGDLLRKVGALELKLSSCRNIVKEAPSHSTKLNGNLSPSANNLSKKSSQSAIHQKDRFSKEAIN